MTTNFLFLDESESPQRKDGTKIIALTGILIPAENFCKIRDSFFQLISPLFVSCKNDGTKIINQVPELHASTMLRYNDDSELSALFSDRQRINCFENIARLTSSYDLAVYRVAYYCTKSTKSLFLSQTNNGRSNSPILSLCWDGILRVLQPTLNDSLVIPIMDSTDTKGVLRFSGPIEMMNAMHVAGVGDSIGINNYQNLGEVYFADSKFSRMTQIADIISYIRCINDQMHEGIPLSEFKKKIYNCNTIIQNVIKHDSVTELNVKFVDRIHNSVEDIVV